MKKKFLADLVLLGVVLVWGTTFVLIKGAIDTMPPFTFLGVRFLFAAAILWLFMRLFYPHTLKGWGKGIWLSGTWLGILLFAGYVFQTFGLKYTTASSSGFITGLSVVLVPFFSLWLLKHRLKRNALIGVAVATIGLAMLSLTNGLSVNFGDFLTFLCAIGFGLHIAFVGRFAPRYHAFSLALLQIFWCGVFNLIGAFLFEDVGASFTASVMFEPWVFTSLAICSVLGTSVAFVAQNQFQKFTTPTRTALIFSMEPVFAAATGFLASGDRLNVLQVIGCVLILGGTLVSELGGSSEEGESSTAELSASQT